MKNLRIVFVVLLAVILLFSLTACEEDRTSNLPSGFDKLASTMLLPKEEGLKKIDLSEADLTDTEHRTLSTGHTVDFCGAKFDLKIGISKVDLEGTEGIYYFEYTTILQDNKIAAEVASAVAKNLTEIYGRSLDPRGQNPDSFRLAEASVEEIQAKLDTYQYTNYDFWYVKEITSERTKKYGEMMEENYNRTPHDKAYLELDMITISAESGVKISIVGCIDMGESFEQNAAK